MDSPIYDSVVSDLGYDPLLETDMEDAVLVIAEEDAES
jgi:hypothetical protein